MFHGCWLAIWLVAACGAPPAPTTPLSARAPARASEGGLDVERFCARYLAEHPPPEPAASPTCDGPDGTRDPRCDEVTTSDADLGRAICDVGAGQIDVGDGWAVSTFVVGEHMNTPAVDCHVALGRASRWWLVGDKFDCSTGGDRLALDGARRAADGGLVIELHTVNGRESLRCTLGAQVTCAAR